MIRPAHQALRWVLPELSPILVPEKAALGLLGLASAFPELGSTQYIECRLGRVAEVGPIDFLVSANKFQRHHLWDNLRNLDDRPGLMSMKRLMADWVCPTSLLYDRVPVVWFEFDDAPRQTCFAASVCLCLVPSYIDPFAPLTSAVTDDVIPMLGHAAHAVQIDHDLLEDLWCLTPRLGRMPVNAHWIHLSMMTARDPLQIKLYGVFPRASLTSYLREIGWAGDLQAIEKHLARYCPRERTDDIVYVDLPVSGMFDPLRAGLGLCFSQQQLRRAEDGDPGRRRLLRALVEDELCRDDQLDALLGWPGRGAVSSEASMLPTSVRRWFDIKVVHRANQPLQAKAYLGFRAETWFPLGAPLQDESRPQ